MLNNEITVTDAEELESFLVCPIAFFSCTQNVVCQADGNNQPNAKQSLPSMSLVISTGVNQGLQVYISFGILHKTSTQYSFDELIYPFC